MIQQQQVYIYISLLTLCVLGVLTFIPEFGETKGVQVISLILLATIGILHGANDLLIFRNSYSGKISAVFFVGAYLFFAAIIGVLIYLDPVIGINFFVLISAFHFGEEHFSWWKNTKNPAFILWCFFYGLSIFSILFLTHLETLEAFIQDNGYQIVALSWSYYLLIPIMVVQVVLGLAHLFLGKIKWTQLVFLQGTIALLYFIFIRLDLLAAFAFYFVFWHSIPSIISQLKELNLTGWSGLSIYIKGALPFYAVSIVGLLGLYFWLGSALFALSTIVLVGAMTTIPHIAVFVYLRMLRPSQD